MVINITIITIIIAIMCHTVIIRDIMDMRVSLELAAHLVELTSKKLASATSTEILRFRRFSMIDAWPCDFVETCLSFRCCLVLDNVGYYTPPE